MGALLQAAGQLLHCQLPPPIRKTLLAAADGEQLESDYQVQGDNSAPSFSRTAKLYTEVVI